MSERLAKIDELIAQQLGQIIVAELELPPGAIATITRVRTSPDLKQAKVYLSIWPETEQRTVMALLINRVKDLQQALAAKISLRQTPRLKFISDPTEQEALKIEKLLDELKK